MQGIQTIETPVDIVIQFPYALREAFRGIFKTAPWDRARNGFVVKSTAANKKKLQVFTEAAGAALQALASADEMDATAQELERMRAELESVRERASRSSQAAENIRSEMARLRPLLDSATQLAKQAQAELLDAEASRQKALGPVREVVEMLGVERAMKTLRYFAGKKFLLAQEKTDFSAACTVMRKANEHLRESLGVTLPALDELAECNYNRLDNTKLTIARHADIYAGVVKGGG